MNAVTTLAGEIRRHHEAAQAAAETAIGHAREAGRLLNEAKAQCQHGGWLPWLRDNFDGSKRTAQAYMRLADRWPEIEAKAQRPAHLSIDGALKLLAEPDDLEKARAGLGRREEIQREMTKLNTALDIATEPAEVADIAHRATAYEIELAEVRIRAERKVGEMRADNPMLADVQNAGKLDELIDALAEKNVNPYREIQHRARDAEIRAEAAFRAEIWDLAPGVKFDRGMQLPRDLSFENWKAIGELLASRMPL